MGGCGIIKVMNEIKQLLEEILRRDFEAPERVTVEVSVPPELDETGEFRPDVATNVAMKLAGVLSKISGEKKNPREVAEKLREKFLESIKEGGLAGTKVEIAGPGFMNFMLPDGYFVGILEELSRDFEKNISCDEYKNKVVVAEFSDPNPFKVLHVGHLYTSIVGESISRLIEFAGGEVHRVNFGGDVGLHVAKTLYVLCGSSSGAITANDSLSEARSSRPSSRGSAATPRQQPPDPPTKERSPRQPEDELFTIEDIAEAYVEGTRLYEEDEEAKKRIIELNKKIYEIAAQGEGNYEEMSEEDRSLAEMYWRGRKLSYEYFDEFYARIGVKFEKYYPESTVVGRGLQTIKEHMPEVYQESDGAVVFHGEEFGLHTRVFINKEGLPTYETKDVGLIFAKNEDYHFDESVVITGNDIIEYMKVVLKSVEQYAPELVEKTRHITHGNVRLPGNEKMSSRKGNFVKAVDVLAMAPLDAIKYSFLKYKIGGNIEFNAEESVAMTGNSGIYLQYSAVRAKKVLARLRSPSLLGLGKKRPQEEKVSRSPEEKFEIELIKKFSQYKRVLIDAVEEKAPHLVCAYLFELAQEFSRFYENCQVAGSERETERGEMVKVFYKIMEHRLGLLGISIPEEM